MSMPAWFVESTFKVRIVVLWFELLEFQIDQSVIIFIFVFVGRGRRSHAYTHSVQVDHHVFLNLRTLKVTFISNIGGNEW